MIFLSLKTYKQATGDAVIKLLSSVKKISEETGITIIPVTQSTDIYRIKKELNIEVWAQHMDPIDPGKNMGWISPYSLKNAGATGVVINHSEHKVSDEIIKSTIEKAKQYDFKTILIGHDVDMVLRFSSMGADYLSYEREDMVGGGISMLTKETENVKNLVSKLKTPLLIGAGVSTGEDVKAALTLGAKGVILASAFTLASDPEAKLRELANGFKS